MLNSRVKSIFKLGHPLPVLIVYMVEKHLPPPGDTWRQPLCITSKRWSWRGCLSRVGINDIHGGTTVLLTPPWMNMEMIKLSLWGSELWIWITNYNFAHFNNDSIVNPNDPSLIWFNHNAGVNLLVPSVSLSTTFLTKCVLHCFMEAHADEICQLSQAEHNLLLSSNITIQMIGGCRFLAANLAED